MKPSSLEHLEQSLIAPVKRRPRAAWSGPLHDFISASATAAKPVVATFDESRNKDQTHRSVRNQYENLPYPLRDPDDDKKFLMCLLCDYLPAVNTNCWGGKRNFNSGFRALVAGGGTGDASTFLAVQLAKIPNAEIVYVDLSTASMEVARKRLHNQAERLGEPRIAEVVDFRLASLLDVGSMNLGKFDYVNCSGVLHHLKSPIDGLRSLEGVLADDGVMSIMVYGQIGRTGIYSIQQMMRLLNSVSESDDDIDTRIEQTWELLDSLPSSNLHRRNGRWQRTSNRVETYDLFLHSQDRAYTLEQLHQWVASAGVHIVDFAPPTRGQLTPAYLPYRLPHTIRELLPKMPPMLYQSFAEYFCGGINTWEFWLKRNAERQNGSVAASLDDDDMVPFFCSLAHGQQLAQTLPAFAAKKQCGMPILFTIPSKPTPITVPVLTTPFAMSVYALIDNSATLGKIVQRLHVELPTLSVENIRRDVHTVLAPLVGLDVVLLRHKDARSSLLNDKKF
ncbi:MAG: class I SAM-dependent methyltransferase [Thermoguttaceae bacterium]